MVSIGLRTRVPFWLAPGALIFYSYISPCHFDIAVGRRKNVWVILGRRITNINACAKGVVYIMLMV